MEMNQQMEMLRHRDKVWNSDLPIEVKRVAVQSLRGFRTVPNQLSNISMSMREEAYRSFEEADTDKEFVEAVIDHHLKMIEKIIRMAEEWTDLLEELVGE